MKSKSLNYSQPRQESDTHPRHSDYKFLAHKSPIPARYVWWILVFTLLAIGFTLLVTRNNGDDSDLNFIAEVLGIGFCVNIIASIVIMVFFTQRDKRIRSFHERSAARRVALEIARYLRSYPASAHVSPVSIDPAAHSTSKASPADITVLRDKLEYLLDTLHFALSDDVKRDIEAFLRTTEDDAAGTDPDKTALNEIETIAAALKNHYGEEIFTTTANRKANR